VAVSVEVGVKTSISTAATKGKITQNGESQIAEFWCDAEKIARKTNVVVLEQPFAIPQPRK
jgi:hypothetical protein